jgi:hypothetical protein
LSRMPRVRSAPPPQAAADARRWQRLVGEQFRQAQAEASVCRSGAPAARATRRQMSPWARYVPTGGGVPAQPTRGWRARRVLGIHGCPRRAAPRR